MILGLSDFVEISDKKFIDEMIHLIFHDGDVRPVWIGGGLAKTNLEGATPQGVPYVNYPKWANEHWALYHSFLRYMPNPKSKLSILDLGCGAGSCAKNLGTIFKSSTITGVDIDPQSLNFAIQYNGDDNILYKEVDITKTPFSEKFDYIFAIEILEHIKHEYHHLVIDWCLEMLSDQGKLFISTPNEEISAHGEKGHIGVLDKHHFNEMRNKYNNNLEIVKYLNSEKLLSGEEYITDNTEDNHFHLVFKRRQ